MKNKMKPPTQIKTDPIDISTQVKPERGYTFSMEFFNEQVSEESVKEEKLDNDLDFDFPGCDLDILETGFTDFRTPLTDF